MIRMKPEEARRAGLLDPLIARDLRASAPHKVSQAKGSTNEDQSKAKRKSKSRPAPAVIPGETIPGDGRVALDPQGVVQQAFFDFRVMPVPKERPRVFQDPNTGKMRSITPKRTAAFHEEIKKVLKEVMRGHSVMDGPLRVDMTFRMPLPVSWPKWRKEAAVDGIIRPTGRPDMDNLEKALLDAFNGELIKDDSLVIERDARKVYALMPGIEVQVSRILAGGLDISRQQAELLRKLREICR